MTPFDVMMSGFTTDASFTLTPLVPFIFTGEPSTVLTVTLPVKSAASVFSGTTWYVKIDINFSLFSGFRCQQRYL